MWKRLFGGKQAAAAIIIVSGLPRSGTSMMMRMLAAGGLEIVTDNIRQADADNPRGYFEFERVKHVKDDPSFLDAMRGKAVKMVSLLLRDLPPDKPYKIIFMQRRLEEVLRSQNVMLQRNAENSQAASDEAMGSIFAKHLADITRWLQEQDNMDVLYVHYNDVLADALPSAQAVDHFLDHRLDVQRMVAAVDRSLYRNRAAQY